MYNDFPSRMRNLWVYYYTAQWKLYHMFLCNFQVENIIIIILYHTLQIIWCHWLLLVNCNHIAYYSIQNTLYCIIFPVHTWKYLYHEYIIMSCNNKILQEDHIYSITLYLDDFWINHARVRCTKEESKETWWYQYYRLSRCVLLLTM